MMLKNFFYVIALVCLFAVSANSQARRWETYTAMKDIRDIEVVPGTNEVFCATSGGLFEVDMQLGTVKKKFTNVDGLLAVDLLSVKLDNHNRLWIGGSDGSISIYDYQSEAWSYIYDIKNSTEVDKSINDFLLRGSFMYVATGYGIQKISTNDLNFVDAPYSQLGTFPANVTKVNKLALLGNTFFAATDAGMAYVNINSNLNNPSSWTNFSNPPLHNDVGAITEFNNMIFVGSPSGLLFYDGAGWIVYPDPTLASSNIKSLTSSNSRLYIATNNNIYYADAGNLANPVLFQSNGDYTDIDIDPNSNPVIGTSQSGVGIFLNSNYTFFFPNGPNTNNFFDINFDNQGLLWACSGNLPNAGVFSFDGSTWTGYTTSNTPSLGSSNDFRKIVTNEGRVWMLSFGGGATLYENGTFTNFNPSNSGMPPSGPNTSFCVPTSGAYDLNGNLWTGFWTVNVGLSSVSVYASSQWINVPIPVVGSNNGLDEMQVDEYNTKWFVANLNANRLYFYNENGTLQNFSDDTYGFYSTNEFSSEVSVLTDMVIDKNGEIWVSTNNGVFIISSPVSVLQGQKSQPRKMGIISGNLIVPFTESCRCLAIDELNNKWIGTALNGAFYLSEDGTTLFEQFNTLNSPILSNSIETIGVNPADGKAYFGTNVGLSSVNTDAVQPVEEFTDIICSPNPFLLPSSVDLRIDGLVEGSSIKIVTLTGDLIAEFESPGGKIATWTNSRNASIASGIYMVIAYNKDGSKVGAGKFAVVKK